MVFKRDKLTTYDVALFFRISILKRSTEMV